MRSKYITPTQIGLAFLLILLSFGASLSLVAFTDYDPTPPDAIGAINSILQSDLERLSFEFSSPNTYLPNEELYSPLPAYRAFLNTPLPLLQAAEKYKESCRAEDFHRADLIAKKFSLSPSKLLSWYLALCQSDLKSFHLWLRRPPFLHPSGISYSRLYFDQLQTKPDQDLYNLLNQRLHVTERETHTPFDNWYLSLTDDQKSQYTLWQRLQILDPWVVIDKGWDGQSQRVEVFKHSEVQNYLRQRHSTEIHPLSRAQSCYFVFDQICGSISASGLPILKSYWFVVTLGSLPFILLSFAINIAFSNHRAVRALESEQAFLFRVIAHEIRTPLTSIGLSLDRIRTLFDQMSEQGQMALLELLSAHQDLRKIVGKSLNELSGQNHLTEIELNQAASELIERSYQGLVTLHLSDTDLWVRTSLFWLEVSLKNLINNALKHGEGQVELRLSSSENHEALIEVRDQGKVSAKKLREATGSFVKGSSSDGLGLGLSIVKRKAKEVGAKLLILGEPTRFILIYKLVRHSDAKTHSIP